MLGALFYPIGTEEEPIKFENLYIPYIYKEIWFDGVYVDITNGRKDMVVVDVGANIGIVTEFLRQFSKKVYAIEPASEHFEALKMNKEYNHWDNVEIFNVAIDNHNGEEPFYKNLSNRTCNSLANKWKGGVSEMVKVMAMDTFFEENKIEQVDFMKFDVEFAEDVILRSEGFKKVAEKIKAIEIEFHHPSWPALAQHMESLGFKGRRYPCDAIIILFTR